MLLIINIVFADRIGIVKQKNVVDNSKTVSEEEEENKEIAKEEEDTIVDIESDFIDASGYDVSEYTDLKLKSYDDLIVLISDDDEELIPGVIVYAPRAYYDDLEDALPLNERFPSTINFMTISSEKNVQNEQEQEAFDSAKKDIKERNITADWLQSNASIALTYSYRGSAGYYFVREIPNVEYQGAEYTFATLSLGGFQDTPFISEDGTNFNISVYAIVGENLVHLKAHGSTGKDLGVSDTEHLSCKEGESGEEGYYAYDIDCMEEILMSSKYDTKIQSILEELVTQFALEE